MNPMGGSGGRPSDPIWNHFNRLAVPGKKYYEADCKYCDKIFKVGKPSELKFHIIECKQAPEEVVLSVRAMIPTDEDGNLIRPGSNKRNSVAAFDEDAQSRRGSPGFSRPRAPSGISGRAMAAAAAAAAAASALDATDDDLDGNAGPGPSSSGVASARGEMAKTTLVTSSGFLSYFPDFELPDHAHTIVRLSELNAPTPLDRKAGFDQGGDFGYPLILIFIRGFFCPKDQEQLKQMVAASNEFKVASAKIAVVSVDPPLVNAAFRAGLGADFTFFSDEGGMIVRRLGLLDNTEGEYPGRSRPYTFVLDGRLKIKRSFDGWWFAGRPSIEELRKDVRAILSRRVSYRYEAWTKPEVTAIRVPAEVWSHGLIPIPSRGGTEATGTVRWFDTTTGNGAIAVSNNYWTRGRGTISWMDFMGNINNEGPMLEGDGGSGGGAAVASGAGGGVPAAVAGGPPAAGVSASGAVPSAEDEVFFNFTAIPGVGFRTLKPGQKVRFELLRHRSG
ncbi:hypothetical protein HDU67_008995, partial [Dinochytrium kinnereticum]